MRAKICGITQLSDAQHAVQYGAWAIGFNFIPESPRYVLTSHAKYLSDQLPTRLLKIGICANTSYKALADTIDDLGLDYIQVYQEINTPKVFKQQMILALPIAIESELPPVSVLNQYGYLLLDAPRVVHHPLGGSGRLSNWHLAKKLAQDYRLILAGGLTPTNLTEAIDTVNPYAVDVASGVESAPGIKDVLLLKSFLMGEHHEH